MNTPVEKDDLSLDRDIFLRQLIRELAGTLEEVIGLNEASDFISIVGQQLGDWINDKYQLSTGKTHFSREEVADILVDLKRRINGGFSVTEQDDEKISLRNTICPFSNGVLGRPSMCMMTSNVFGVIAADNLGYAKVELQKTIADGDGHCEVIVYIKQTAEAKSCTGREYFAAD